MIKALCRADWIRAFFVTAIVAVMVGVGVQAEAPVRSNVEFCAERILASASDTVQVAVFNPAPTNNKSLPLDAIREFFCCEMQGVVQLLSWIDGAVVRNSNSVVWILKIHREIAGKIASDKMGCDPLSWRLSVVFPNYIDVPDFLFGVRVRNASINFDDLNSNVSSKLGSGGPFKALIGLDRLVSGARSGSRSLARFIKGERNINDPHACYDQHDQSPFCHVLLGLQIVGIGGILIWGFQRLFRALTVKSELAKFYARQEAIMFLGCGGVAAFVAVYVAINSPYC